MATRAKTTTPVDPVEAAAKRATIPTRPVIEHTKLFRASLQVQQSAATDALSLVDRDLVHAADTRAEEMEAANRAYGMAMALADQKYDAIRTELDAERVAIISVIDSIDAALAKLDPAPADESNVVQIAAE